MEIITRKDTIAIVVVGYNRLESLKRLLHSLIIAEYPDISIPLIISIDCSNNKTLYNYVEEFKWPHGEKYLNIEKKQLGLKKHIIKCGGYTKYYKAIVLLEDDIFVSPFFYEFVSKTVDKYGNDEIIAQISLYKNEMNGFAYLPFDYFQNGSDVFLMQSVSTWGECWNERMWNDFITWMEKTYNDEIMDMVDIPDRVKKWKRAWSKYFNAYLVYNNIYTLYPYTSLSTNFNDAGVHGNDNNSHVQVNILQGHKDYVLLDSDKLVKYDIYGNNKSIYKWVDIPERDLCLDLYCINRNKCRKKFYLTTARLNHQIIKSYSLNMRPIELNIKYGIEGNGIFIYNTAGNYIKKGLIIPSGLYAYFLRNFTIYGLPKHIIVSIIKYLKNLIKL